MKKISYVAGKNCKKLTEYMEGDENGK